MLVVWGPDELPVKRQWGMTRVLDQPCWGNAVLQDTAGRCSVRHVQVHARQSGSFAAHVLVQCVEQDAGLHTPCSG